MYNIKPFNNQSINKIIAFIKQYPFAVICGMDNEFPVVAQLPLLIEDSGNNHLKISGHFMMETDHGKAFLKNQSIVASFVGPNAYVSASWYDNPHQASTWNYMSVYIKGKMKFTDDDTLKNILRKTTDLFENDVNSPAAYDNLSKEYILQSLPLIKGFEIDILNISSVFKLSQNRNEKSYNNIIHQLSIQNEDAKFLAEEMQKRKASLFQK